MITDRLRIRKPDESGEQNDRQISSESALSDELSSWTFAQDMKTRTRPLFWLLFGLLAVILITLALPIPPVQAKQNATRARLAALQESVRQFVADHDRQPSAAEVEVIIAKVLGENTSDSWGTPFKWITAQSNVVMLSAGPDKALGTRDDLTDQ
jgi:hypothetical protein